MIQLTKDMKTFAHLVILLKEKNQTLRKTNKAFAKRRKAKCTYLQTDGSFNLKEARILIA